MLIFSLWFCVGGLCQEVQFPVSLCAHACMCVCVFMWASRQVCLCVMAAFLPVQLYEFERTKKNTQRQNAQSVT